MLLTRAPSCSYALALTATMPIKTYSPETGNPHEQLARLFSEAVFVQVNHINEIFNLLPMTEPFVHLFDELNWKKNNTWSLLAGITIKQKHFNCFFMLFLFPIWQQISYQSIESSDPSINVPGPRRTVSKLKNETYHMFSNLHPGTTYLISVRARTAKGFGQTALTEITTNISGTSAAVGASVLSWGRCEIWRKIVR